MGKGVLEVHLVDARGLSGSDFLGACTGRLSRPNCCAPPSRVVLRFLGLLLRSRVFGRIIRRSIWSDGVLRWRCRLLPAGKIDPYVIVQYRSQERKSRVARGQPRYRFFFFLLNPPFSGHA